MWFKNKYNLFMPNSKSFLFMPKTDLHEPQITMLGTMKSAFKCKLKFKFLLTIAKLVC